MNIVLAGYGKMGKMIEAALQREHQHNIVFRINSSNNALLHNLSDYRADVVIDFSKPDVIEENIRLYIQQQIPAVIGTTGWYHRLEKWKALCEKEQGSILWGSNFSIGVNLYFRIGQYAASLLKHYPEYQVSITETHHKNKLDAPSGTALMLSQFVRTDQQGTEVPIQSIRDEDSIGRHELHYQSTCDQITLIHNATNREGFALGSIRAASWIIHHKGFHNFADIFEQL